MRTWGEAMKTSMINVNLKPCTCPAGYPIRAAEHHGACAAKPVPIPCRLPPIFRPMVKHIACGYFEHCVDGDHDPACHKSIRVSCSIGGETWAESEVVDIERCGPDAPFDAVWDMAAKRVLNTCRGRWALVKALVLGSYCPELNDKPLSPEVTRLLIQRDAVFSALCRMAQAEEACAQELDAFTNAFGRFPNRKVACDQPRPERPSAHLLADYVRHLIEQAARTP